MTLESQLSQVDDEDPSEAFWSSESYWARSLTAFDFDILVSHSNDKQLLNSTTHTMTGNGNGWRCLASYLIYLNLICMHHIDTSAAQNIRSALWGHLLFPTSAPAMHLQPANKINHQQPASDVEMAQWAKQTLTLARTQWCLVSAIARCVHVRFMAKAKLFMFDQVANGDCNAL